MSMPPIGGKTKSKSKEGRQSRSRHTTPNSVLSASSAPITTTAQTHTAYLEYPLANLMVSTNVNYDNILDRHGSGGGIPDPLHLQTMTEDLNTLAQLAQARSQVLDDAMREMAKRKKDFEREEKERQEKEQALREVVAKAEEQARLKQEAEDEENVRARAGAQLKKKNERNNVQEERPLSHGAHGLARQDGQVDMPSKGEREVYFCISVVPT